MNYKIIDIEGIGDAYAPKLIAEGIETVEQLLDACCGPAGRKIIAEKTGISEKLILIHLVGIHFTGTSVNPARSIGPALFDEGGQALRELWVFIVGPLVGGALAACIWKIIDCNCVKKAE